MPAFSQRDPRWRGNYIGVSGRTIGQIGCTITCIAMLTSYFKPERTPAWMAQNLRFDNIGRVFWASVDFENWKFYRRVYHRQDVEIKRHVRAADLAVILEVANKSHWVVATGVEPITGIIRITDPWDGVRTSMRRYQNNITGAAYFIRK